MAQLQIPEINSYSSSQDHHQSIIVPANLISLADSFEKKEQSWFATSDIPTDLAIQVQGITFHVHKYPMVSKCGYLAQVDLQPSQSDSEYNLKLDNFPGGLETFEIILQFCYDLPISLNPDNVASLRCSAEFLEMTEAHEDGNLVSKTEAFLTFVVLSSWGDSITVLKSCESLSPWAENLQIVRRCCDSIAWKASKETIVSGERNYEERWWFEDVATLRIDHFVRIVSALRTKGSKPEIIGSYLVYYAGKWLPGMEVEQERPRRFSYSKNEMQLSVLSNKRLEEKMGYDEQKMIVESLISIMPPQKEAVPCKFLLGLLRMALMYSASLALVSELEKRIGMVLENADAIDLLVLNCANADPSKILNSPDQCTLHNIDIVQRIMEYYIMHEEQQQQKQQQKTRKLISKLLDNYLAEIARDPNLSITKFQVLAETLPDSARACHDGIYRAIDTYLKCHPSLSEHDRRRICKTMNCGKLSLDGCMHAAQNERLPLRIVIQVLLSEQVKLRASMQGKEQTEVSGNSSDKEESQSTKEIRILKEELDNVKANMQELQRDYTELQREYENINHKQQRKSIGWIFNWKKIRTTSFFGGKVDGEETRYGREISTSTNHHRVSLQQRLSVS